MSADALKAIPGAGPVVMKIDEKALEAYCLKHIPGFKGPLV